MDFNQWIQDFIQRTIEFLPQLIFGIIIFAIAVFISGPAARWVEKKAKPRIGDRSTVHLLSIIVRWAIIISGTLFALDKVNFNITRFVAGLGVAGLTVGFALQDITRNFIAGIIMLVNKPFNIGDEIEIAGKTGKVIDINTHDTTITTYDGEQVILPNINVFTSTITNFSTADSHRRTIRIRLPYTENLEHASNVFLEAINRVEGVLQQPAASVLAEGLTETGVTLNARFWINHQTNSLLATHSLVINAIKEAAEQEGITLASPVLLAQNEKTA